MSKIKKNPDLFRNMTSEWKWILHYVYRYRWKVLIYLLLGLVGTVMSLGTAVASKYLIDAVVSHADSKLLKYAGLTISLALFQFVFTAGASWITALVGTKVNNEMREEIFSHIMSVRWEDIHIYHSGELLNRIEGDVSAVSSAVISFIPSVFTRVLQFGGSLAIVLYYDKIMALLSLLSAPFLFFTSRFLIKTMREYNKESRELNGKVLSFSEESIRNIQFIKAFDLTKQYVSSFRTALDNYRKVRLDYEKFSVIITLALSVIGLVVSYLCYGWGVYRLWQGVISYGTMTLFLQIAGGLSSSFSAVAGLVPTAVSTATSAGRIMEITQYSKESDEHRNEALKMLEVSDGSGLSIVSDNITFRYSDGDYDVLSGASFGVRPGETIALIGSSGEGKTTVLKFLLGLVEPTAGEMYAESSDGRRLNLSDSTRRFFSYIPQNVSMFSGTIAENLRLVNGTATDSELESVLRQAEMWDYVSSLPLGMDTVIGEQGENISSGQAQRIAIARALLCKAPVMLMDEATSALDSETESKVLSNIMKISPSRACILTTHRESMLNFCDRIYRINSDGSMEQV